MVRWFLNLVIILIFFISSTLSVEPWLMLNLETTKIPIFGFHDVVESSTNYGLDYENQKLEKFLEYLCKNDYWFLSTDDIKTYFLDRSQQIPQKYIGKKAVLISFDDGYKSMYTQVLPLLRKLSQKYHKNLTVTLFVNSKFITHKNSQKYATCEELKQGLESNFFDIQSHGWRHRRLTHLDLNQLTIELSKGQSILRSCLDDRANAHYSKTVSHIAYAYNDFNHSIQDDVDNYYQSGYLYNNQIFKLGYNQNPYTIPRVRVNQKDTPEDLIKIAEFSSELTQNPQSYTGRMFFNVFANFL